MANKYFDKDNPAAADNPANGSEVAPYITPAYTITQASGGDVLYGGVTATPYDLGAGTVLLINKAVTYTKWENGASGKPEINGGDATRLINLSGVAGTVVIDNYILESTRVGLSAYIIQAGAATRDLTVSNTLFEGSVSAGAVTIAAGGLGVVIAATSEFNMTAGGAVYNTASGGFTSLADVTLNATSQAAFFWSNGNSNAVACRVGGTITLNSADNYVIRCGATNINSNITIDSSFNLASVNSNYTQSAFYIVDPKYFTVESGAVIDTRNSTSVGGPEAWIFSPNGTGATLNGTGEVVIEGLTIRRSTIGQYILKIGDESPFSASHDPNSYANLVVKGCLFIDGTYYGTPGNTNTHCLFIGNEAVHYIENNRVIEGAYGIGIKGDDTADESSYFFNNYVQGQDTAHLKTKGFSGTFWLNNHVVEDGKGGNGIDLTDNTDDGAAGTGDASQVYNHIFEMNTSDAVYIDTASDLGNNKIDYNVYILTGTGNLANASGVSYSSLSAWQELGHDRHSYVVTSRDQIFDSNDEVIWGSVAHRTGKPVINKTPMTDIDGANAPTLTGVTLGTDTNFKQRIRKTF